VIQSVSKSGIFALQAATNDATSLNERSLPVPRLSSHQGVFSRIRPHFGFRASSLLSDEVKGGLLFILAVTTIGALPHIVDWVWHWLS
jgi:hypothetical protein